MGRFATAWRLGAEGCAVGAVMFLLGLSILYLNATPPHVLSGPGWTLVQDGLAFGGLGLALCSAVLLGIVGTLSRAKAA